MSRWTLVGSAESNVAERRLSVESPVGSALRDRRVGDPASIETPRRERRLPIDGLVG